MENSSPKTALLVLSSRLYHLLLLLYPPGFRRQYGGPMQQLFADCCRRALRAGGQASLADLWARTLLDALLTALVEHLQNFKISLQGDLMNTMLWTRLGAWTFPAGGLATTLGLLASTRPAYDPYNFFALWYDRYANLSAVPLIVLGLLLLSGGLMALFYRFRPSLGWTWRLLLVLGAICGFVGAVGAVVNHLNYDGGPWWDLFFFGMDMQFLTLSLFGLVCLRRHLLPGWNWTPLLAGIWLPLLSVLYFFNLNLSEIALYVTLLLTLLGLVGLGLRLASPGSSRTKMVQGA